MIVEKGKRVKEGNAKNGTYYYYQSLYSIKSLMDILTTRCLKSWVRPWPYCVVKAGVEGGLQNIQEGFVFPDLEAS